MGNCPSDLTCADNEIKVCFKDKDRNKRGFCINATNDPYIKNIESGIQVCPDCPSCPDKDKDKDKENDKGTICDNFDSDNLLDFIRSYDGTCSEIIEKLKMYGSETPRDRVGDKFNVSRQYVNKYLIPLIEDDEDKFCNEDGTFNARKIVNSINKTCNGEDLSADEAYTGTYKQNNLMMFFISMLALIFIHLRFQKIGRIF